VYRWIPAYVRYLSYFTNFILLASFLEWGWNFGGTASEVSVPVLSFSFSRDRGGALNRSSSISRARRALFRLGNDGREAGGSFILLPLIFVFVAAPFIPLARSLGLLFTQTEPLTAYTFDILGSLVGTAAFFLIDFLVATNRVVRRAGLLSFR